MRRNPELSSKGTTMKTLGVVLVTLVGGIAAFASVANAQTLQKIADSNKITVSYREASVPFSYLVAPGKAVGLSADLTEAIVADVRKKLNRPNLEVAYMPVNAQNRIPLLANGTYDLECGSTTNTAARGKDVAFAISYFYAGTRLLTRKSAAIRNYSDLANKTVATVGGSTNEKVLRQHSDERKLNIEFSLAKDYAEAWQQLESDRVAALALDDVLLYGMRANAKNPSEFEVVGDTLQVEPYGCMVRKDDPEFKQLVDGTIAGMMKSGEFKRLYSKWFESPMPPKDVNLNMPMSEALAANLTVLSDKPAM
jgi:ABC-type amino acid transport substrate-binding protein